MELTHDSIDAPRATTGAERDSTRAGERHASALALGAALGGFLFGFDTSTMNAALPGMRSTLALGTATLGTIAAGSLLGCAAGAWLASPVSARLGRTRVMLAASLAMLVGALGAALARDVWFVGAARVLTGLGIGAASAVVPAYIVEIAPTRVRGRLGSLWQLSLVVGQLLGLLVGYAFAAWAGGEAEAMPWGGSAWRWLFVVVAAIAAGYALVAQWLPQSPHDALRHGHADAARELLARTHAGSVDRALERVHEDAKSTRLPSLRDVRGPRLGLAPIVWVGLSIAALQQLVGINVVKTYSNTLWRAVGLSAQGSFAASIATVCVSVVSTVIAIAIVDRVGRRPMLLAGGAGMALPLAALAIAFSTATQGPEGLALETGPAVVALVAMNVFAVAFGITWGPLTWLVLGELFDGNLRTSAVAVCTAANWLTNWLVTASFPWIAGANLGLAYGLYAAFALVACAVVWRAVPETRAKAVG